MPCGVFTINDVPDANLAATVAIIQLDHPLKVDTTKQPDGKWTVVATFPPCKSLVDDKKPVLTFDILATHVSLDRLAL
jgi:hypothetical protein